MLLNRHRRLLALLHALGGRVATTDFQKLLFLYCQEEEPGLYDFVPYRFGAFSFTSYADRRRLEARGFLSRGETEWTLTRSGRAAAGTADRALAKFTQAYRRLRGNRLVVETYRRFPYYGTRSEIAAALLRGNPEGLRRIAEARPPRQIGLFTIGYEGRSVEEYLNRLLQAGVTLLCDVRRNPLSRKYGFSKKTLSQACGGVGLRYEHLPELGIDSSDRRGLNSQTDYDALFDRYERELLPRQAAAVKAIADWVGAGEGVALTCYEHAPSRCHRHCVAEAVERVAGSSNAHHL